MSPQPAALPAAFVTDLGPLPAFMDDDYAFALAELGKTLPRPKAVVVMSGHWLARESLGVSASAAPGIVHDYSGFPREFYDFDYPCPGSPELAADVVRRLAQAGVVAREDAKRPLDHGAWAPLSRVYPKTDVPVVQLSVPAGEDPRKIMGVGLALAPLRQEGVLLLASGALVHNLRLLRLGDDAAPEDAWAKAFDAWVLERLDAGKIGELCDYRRLAPEAAKAAPTPEHFDPLFFALGAAEGARPRHLHRSVRYGSGLRRIFAFGA